MQQGTRIYICMIFMACMGVIVGATAARQPAPVPEVVMPLTVTVENTPAVPPVKLQIMTTDRRKQSMKIVHSFADLPNNSLCVGNYSKDQGMVISCTKHR